MWQRFFLFLHLHAVIQVSVWKYLAYPQKYQIVNHSIYFQRASQKLYSTDHL
jgi:hypothetical protein